MKIIRRHQNERPDPMRLHENERPDPMRLHGDPMGTFGDVVSKNAFSLTYRGTDLWGRSVRNVINLVLRTDMSMIQRRSFPQSSMQRIIISGMIMTAGEG